VADYRLMEQEQFIENLESDLREASLAADQSREELCTAHREAARGREDVEAVMRELEATNLNLEEPRAAGVILLPCMLIMHTNPTGVLISDSTAAGLGLSSACHLARLACSLLARRASFR
jgi:hypothetical protein